MSKKREKGKKCEGKDEWMSEKWTKMITRMGNVGRN
jgi:hypothetical protein